MPFTLVHRRHDSHPSVSANDEQGGRIAAHHLIETGRTRLAAVTLPSYMSTGVDRMKGFVEAVEQAGLPSPTIIETAVDVNAGRGAVAELLARAPHTDGIFAVHDATAIAAMSVVREAGLTVPDDVGVVGFYDTPYAVAIGLTSIRVDLRQMGRRALELLIDLLAERPVSSEMLPTTLVRRGSTAHK
jgi:LacI family transcriptional regulator